MQDAIKSVEFIKYLSRFSTTRFFFARSDMLLGKLNRFLISSSREPRRQKKKSLRAKKVAYNGKPALDYI